MRKSTGIGAVLVGLSAALALAGPAFTGGPQKIYADFISSPIKAVKHSLELTYGERDTSQLPATGPSQIGDEQQIMLKPFEVNDELRNHLPIQSKLDPTVPGGGWTPSPVHFGVSRRAAGEGEA